MAKELEQPSAIEPPLSTLKNDLSIELGLASDCSDKEVIDKVIDLQTMVQILEAENAKLESEKSISSTVEIEVPSMMDQLKLTLISYPEIKEIYLSNDGTHYQLREQSLEDYKIVSRDAILKK